MLKFDFGPTGGGVRHFRADDIAGEIQKAVEFCEKEIETWQAALPNHHVQDSYGQSLASKLVQPWADIRDELRRLKASGVAVKLDIEGSIQHVISAKRPLSKHSSTGAVIIEIWRNHGVEGANAALRVRRGEQLNANLRQEAVAGISVYVAATRSIQVLLSKSELADISRETELLRSHGDTLLQSLSERIERLDELATDLDARTTEIEDKAVSVHSMSARRWRGEAALWRSEWEQLRRQFKEELQIAAPVDLWTTRATTHRTNSIWYAGAAAAIAGLGFCAAIIAAVRIRDIARFVVGPPADEAASHWQVIFFASTVLLAVTLFLWAMKTAIRLFITEHHLQIDASGRAALAQTYLALIKDGAAEKEDRAIVLASLFRSVSDGLVKDDGLPSLSPAALAASTLMDRK
jgi:hypothetical protein